jgi:hypothetical protein
MVGSLVEGWWLMAGGWWWWRRCVVVVFLGGHVSGIPDLIDEDIDDVAAVFSFMEHEPVWDVGGCFHLDHGKDRRVVVATERCMFNA